MASVRGLPATAAGVGKTARGRAKGLRDVTTEVRQAGVAQLARASAFQAEGRGFESRLPLSDAGSSTRPVGGEAPVAQW